MSTWLPALFGKRDSAKSATEAIVTLRKQLAILEKKDDHLQNKIEIEHKKAKELLAANKKSAHFFAYLVIINTLFRCYFITDLLFWPSFILLLSDYYWVARRGDWGIAKKESIRNSAFPA